eukprot:TRINITY_DN5040_c0_g1_i8.p1 TRINITY_DN5040_c0_g1~~TRINITY_DN5040_c0_g1_i8.p1  ORF type:complete len:688 (-),score=186.29 TRINITY_DN5040_c0_g1_i8:678-2741(-)
MYLARAFPTIPAGTETKSKFATTFETLSADGVTFPLDLNYYPARTTRSSESPAQRKGTKLPQSPSANIPPNQMNIRQLIAESESIYAALRERIQARNTGPREIEPRLERIGILNNALMEKLETVGNDNALMQKVETVTELNTKLVAELDDLKNGMIPRQDVMEKIDRILSTAQVQNVGQRTGSSRSLAPINTADAAGQQGSRQPSPKSPVPPLSFPNGSAAQLGPSKQGSPRGQRSPVNELAGSTLQVPGSGDYLNSSAVGSMKEKYMRKRSSERMLNSENESLRKKIADLEQALKTKDEETLKFKDQVAASKKEVENAIRERETVKVKLEQVESEVAVLSKNLPNQTAQLQKRLHEAGDKLALAQADANTLRGLLTKAEEQLTKTLDEKASFQKKFYEADAKVYELKINLEKTQSELSRFQKEKEVEVLILTNKLNLAKDEKDSALSRAEIFTKEKNAAVDRQQHAEAELNAAKDLSNQLKVEVDNLGKQMKKLQADKAKLLEQCTRLAKDLEKYQRPGGSPGNAKFAQSMPNRASSSGQQRLERPTLRTFQPRYVDGEMVLDAEDVVERPETCFEIPIESKRRLGLGLKYMKDHPPREITYDPQIFGVEDVYEGHEQDRIQFKVAALLPGATVYEDRDIKVSAETKLFDDLNSNRQFLRVELGIENVTRERLTDFQVSIKGGESN